MNSGDDLDIIILTAIFMGLFWFVRLVFKDKDENAPPDDASQRTAMPDAASPAPPGAPPRIPIPEPRLQQFERQAGGEVVGVFVVLTSGDEMTQMVAMSLSNQMKEKGKDVRVLLCGSAGDLALASTRGTSFAPLDKTPQMLMKALMGKGVKVEICPFYLPHKGKSSAELVQGVTIAKPPEVADGLIAPGYKMFTF